MTCHSCCALCYRIWTLDVAETTNIINGEDIKYCFIHFIMMAYNTSSVDPTFLMFLILAQNVKCRRNIVFGIYISGPSS